MSESHLQPRHFRLWRSSPRERSRGWEPMSRFSIFAKVDSMAGATFTASMIPTHCLSIESGEIHQKEASGGTGCLFLLPSVKIRQCEKLNTEPLGGSIRGRSQKLEQNGIQHFRITGRHHLIGDFRGDGKSLPRLRIESVF